MSQGADYRKIEQRFLAAGIEAAPADAPTRPNRLALAKNVRSIVRGTIQSRLGTSLVLTAAAGTTPAHSLTCLNNVPAADYTYVAGVGTTLQQGKTGTLVTRATGFSGAPLSLQNFTPEQASLPWVAVADANKLVKIDFNGNVHQLGLPTPTIPPNAEFDWVHGPLRTVVDAAAASAGWSVPGGAAIAYLNRAARATGVQAYAGNDPTLGLGFGWFAVGLNSLTDIGPGTILYDNAAPANTLFVEEVHPASPASAVCTISRIIYDNGGTSGWATIYPSQAFDQFQQHALVRFVGGVTNYAALTHTIPGPDNSVALRCYFLFAGTVEGDAITVLPSVYGYISVAIGANVSSDAVKWTTLPISTVNYLTKTGLALDLSTFTAAGRAIDVLNDELHCSLFISDITRINEIKIEADVDDGTFGKNWYSRSIRASDYALLSTQAVSAIDTRQTTARRETLDRFRNNGVGGRRNFDTAEPIDIVPQDLAPVDSGPVVDNPGGASGQTGTGASQWSEIRFKLSDFRKNGTDKSKTLAAVNAIRFVVSTNDTGTVDFGFGSFYIVGGSEPDVGDGAPYEFEYRYRCSSTGARSNWSPPSRSPLAPHRYQLRISATPSGVAECDTIDFRRRGGAVNVWVNYASASNSGGGVLLDIYGDSYTSALADSDRALEGNVNAQPFTEITAAYIATVAEIAGNAVRHGTNGFNVLWAQGTPVIANGIVTAIYRVVSTDVMLLYDNVGGGTNVRVELPEPRIVGQPLPIIFGSVDGWSYAVGSKINPGRLYIFNRGTLDSTQSSFFVDLADASEPLQNGCVHGNRGYVWSTQHMWTFLPNMASDERIDKQLITGAPGLRFPHALSAGKHLRWLANDGVYESNGADYTNITRPALQPIFVNEGAAAVADYHGIPVPDFSAGQANNHRISADDEDKMLYYDYPALTGGVRTVLALDCSAGEGDDAGWWIDTHAFGSVTHRADERVNGYRVLIGGADAGTAKIYTFDPAANGDNGSAIPCLFRTFASAAGDDGNRKRMGDATIELDAGGVVVSTAYLFDNYVATVAGTASTTGQLQSDAPLRTELDRYARNIATELSWSVTSSAHKPVIYLWAFTYLPRPDDAQRRPDDFSDLSHWGPKEMRAYDVECDTGGVAKAIALDYTKEDGTLGTVTASVTSSYKTTVPVVVSPPVIGREFRVRGNDATLWKEFEVSKWHFDPLPDMTPMLGEYTVFEGLRWVQGVELYADTNNVVVPVDFQRDFAEVVRTITAQHPGRGTKSYAFDPPFLAYMVRPAPTAAARIINARFISNPEAPLGTLWETQEYELGEPYGMGQQLEVEYAAASAVTMEWWVDGVQVQINNAILTSTGGTETFRKHRLRVSSTKGRLGKLKFRCAAPGCRIRERGTRMRLVPFAEEPRWWSMAGALHRTTGAEV